MPSRDPNNLDSFLSWIPILLISGFGGVAKYLTDRQYNKTRWNIWEFLSQILVSAFAGFIGGLVCVSSGLDQNMTWIGAGLSGYMGSIALNAFWRFFSARTGVNHD
ncbi:phage holin family protein [Testudinibacter sp. P80/BLE/0925]|uniref:phage holin family protein n=1 Tax=Testudinibacter sp. TW-1 TaxID=3417757 RepID=UPI003D36BF8E